MKARVSTAGATREREDSGAAHIAHRQQAAVEKHEDAEYGEEQARSGEADANLAVVIERVHGDYVRFCGLAGDEQKAAAAALTAIQWQHDFKKVARATCRSADVASVNEPADFLKSF